MWPFKKTAEVQKAENLTEIRIRTLQAWRPVGTTINYLGRECVVTRHWDWFFDRPTYPILRVEYADNLGVIRFHQFRWGEALAIMEKQP